MKKRRHKIDSTALVIGSGVGGLATAARLAAHGCQVTVFEQNSHYGGKVSRIEKDGYFWGFGASLFTFPELLDEVFAICGRNPADYYHYSRIDPICRYFYPDGTRLDAYAEPAKFAAELEKKTGEPQTHTLKYLKESEQVYEMTKDIFLFNSLHKLSTYMSRQTLKSLFNFGKIGISKNLNKVNEQQFDDPRVVQLFNRYATYNGSDPYIAPSTLRVISHPEYGRGAYFLDGGMPDLTRSLYQLCLDMGVKFEFNATVESIKVSEGSASGLIVNKKHHEADIVVSNMDVVYTYQKLMPEQQAPRSLSERDKSTSALIFYWGIKREFPQLELHNIFFSGDYRTEFEYLSGRKLVYSDPTVYIYISSKKQKDHAPEGCENWFTLINVPHDSGQDWDEIVAKARRNILDKINKELGIDMEPLIHCETVNDPRTIQSKTQSHLGALYGNSSNDIFSAFLRHPNFSSRIKGLYFAGGSVHPGGGVPLCLLSAKIIDELIG